MTRVFRMALVLSSLLLAGCEAEQSLPLPPPFALTSEAIGRYCGMNVLEHAGPKGQIILDARIGEPIWFSSARDTLAFTMLPEEAKDYAAIYVSDMGKAVSWDEPGAENWVDAKKAFYVIGSTLRGGMGVEETVPFAEQSAAADLALKNGGKVVTFDEVPHDYVLGSDVGETMDGTAVQHTEGQDHG